MHNAGVPSTLYPENVDNAADQPSENPHCATKAGRICRKLGEYRTAHGRFKPPLPSSIKPLAIFITRYKCLEIG